MSATCTNCAALQAQIDALLASRASRSSDTPKAKRTAAFPRKGHRLAILKRVAHEMVLVPHDLAVGAEYGRCPWKRLSELCQMGLVKRYNSGGYMLTDEGSRWLSELRRQA